MRKAHQSEVQREVARFKQEFLKQFQQKGERTMDSTKAKEYVVLLLCSMCIYLLFFPLFLYLLTQTLSYHILTQLATNHHAYRTHTHTHMHSIP